MANQPYDVSPDNSTTTPIQIQKPSAEARASGNGPASSRTSQRTATVRPAPSPARDRVDQQAGGKPAPEVNPAPRQNELRYAAAQNDAVSSDAPVDVRADVWLNSPTIGILPDAASSTGGARASGLQTAAWLPPAADPRFPERRKLELNIPSRLPGAEAPRVDLPPFEDKVARAREIDRIYPELPPMPAEPKPLPGPDGQPYTLTELQRIAAANSPALRQAVADVENARGAVVQARTYVNPTASYVVDPSNNNSTAGVQGFAIDQPIITGGKKKLSVASSQKDYENALLALRRARNDLATQVRQAYFALLVDKETLVVTRAVARFTDEIYRLQTGMLQGTLVAAYEPATLRAQVFAARLAYQQAITTYTLDWKSLVAILGLQQLPLTQVGGQIDRFIPYYDYDDVLAYVLRNHTDILTARNRVPQARYNLKLAQVTPILPDIDVRYSHEKDYALAPFGTYQTLSVGMPLVIWDRNKGNIISAQAALIRATEEQHNAEINLTNNFANAYTNYKNSLYAIDYYRRYILPDLVRYYRGVYERRPVQPDAVNVGDLAFAQQSLAQSITAYLTVLGSMWQSVVGVAAFLQTDDLFQMATPRPLPELPDFDELSQWACGHATIAASCGVDAVGQPGAATPKVAPTHRGGDLSPAAANDFPRGVRRTKNPSPTDPPSPNAGATLSTQPANSPSPSAGATLASRRPRPGQQDDR